MLGWHLRGVAGKYAKGLLRPEPSAKYGENVSSTDKLWRNGRYHRVAAQGLRSSYEAIEFATLEWVDRFNNWRLLQPVGK